MSQGTWFQDVWPMMQLQDGLKTAVKLEPTRTISPQLEPAVGTQFQPGCPPMPLQHGFKVME